MMTEEKFSATRFKSWTAARMVMPRSLSSPQQGDQFDLTADVEVLRGLVEQHQLRLLRQADGDLHPLALAAR